MIAELSSRILRKASLLPDKLINRIFPTKPYDFLRAQGKNFSEYLPYVSYLDLQRPTCLLKDGALGVMWELTAIPHETTKHDDLVAKLENISAFFNQENGEVSFQIIFDSEPALNINYYNNSNTDNTSPEFFIQERVKQIEGFSKQSKSHLRLMKRKCFLVIRLSRKSSPLTKTQIITDDSELELESIEFDKQAQILNTICDEVEYNLKHAGIRFYLLNSNDFMLYMRDFLHSVSERKSNETLKSSYLSDRDFSSQILKSNLEVSPHSVSVGEDSFEVLSWIDQPPTVYFGLFSKLLILDIPIRFVLNIRKCSDLSDLDRKMFLLRNATDPFGEMQRGEIRATYDRIARGESLSFVSMHIFVRNCNLDNHKIKESGIAKSLISKLKTLIQTDFTIEKYAAPLIFMTSLPFCYSKECAGFTGREKRVLSKNIAPYLPLYGGFQGTRNEFQLMVSRAGEAIWLNPFDSETSPHIAVLASSGGGKSFFAQNMMMSFFAKEGHKNPLLFIIDKKTSYEIFARVVGEEFGSQIVKPPDYFPNIFRGKLDDFRLPVIVGILKTAITLVTKDAVLGSIEEMVLSQAVKETFEQNTLDAVTEYKDGTLQKKESGKIKIPRLSDVVDNLFQVCAKLQVSNTIAENLNHYLSSFLDNGPYKSLFNKVEYDDLDPKTPGVSLFDIDFVSTHPVLSTLTTQMILSEILRQIRRPENMGRPGMLVIEEVGVLAQGSSEIVQFIQDAWKTFRKLGFCCVGLTNEVDDYVKKAGAREIWNVSPNKIILKMTSKDLQKAIQGETGFPPLIEDTLIGKVIGSLKKEDGRYSQGLWWSDETVGTFTYIPTGYDYWCAASKPIEVNTVYFVANLFSKKRKPFFESIVYLANKFPNGIREKDGTLRVLSDEEIEKIKEIIHE